MNNKLTFYTFSHFFSNKVSSYRTGRRTNLNVMQIREIWICIQNCWIFIPYFFVIEYLILSNVIILVGILINKMRKTDHFYNRKSSLEKSY